MMKTLLILLLMAVGLTTHADDTRSRRLRPIPATTSTAATPLDTIRGELCDSVRLAGYDKPLRSYSETFLVTNHLPAPISALGIDITYTDTSGRMLHQRTVECRAIIPPGTTRLVKFRSWDSNHTFFYTRGPRPRVSGVTPYDIKAQVAYIVAAKSLTNND
ncbi:MAG: hypothetical protein NC339_01190 [Muribaculaceae bacterium]|nr:hypothetical protein [Muribaculaceae bacterium]